MRKADGVCALICLLLGSLVIYDAWRLGVFGWGSAGPEPGMYIFLLGAGVAVGSLLILGRVVAQARRGEPDKPFIRPGGLKPVLYVSVPAAIMVLMTEFIGLYLAAGLYLAIYMRWIGKHKWLTVAALSILLPLASYFIFDRFFLIPLPKGRFEALLTF